MKFVSIHDKYRETYSPSVNLTKTVCFMKQSSIATKENCIYTVNNLYVLMKVGSERDWKEDGGGGVAGGHK